MLKRFKLSLTPEQTAELEQRMKDQAKPGVVFSEPIHEGDYTLITASRYDIHGRRVTARPVAVIVIGPRGVQVKQIRNLAPLVALALTVSSAIFWTVFLFHPPWKLEMSLLPQVSELIKTIRGEE